jgi:hypothetical protein
MYKINIILLILILHFSGLVSNETVEDESLLSILNQNGISIQIPKNWEMLDAEIVEEFTSTYPPQKFDGGYTIINNSSYYPSLLISISSFERESDSIDIDRLSNLLHNYFRLEENRLMTIDSFSYNLVTNEDFFQYEFIDTIFNLEAKYYNSTLKMKIGDNINYEIRKKIILKNGHIDFYSPFDSLSYINYSDTILNILNSVTVDEYNQIKVFQGSNIEQPKGDDIGILKKLAIILMFLFIITLLLYNTIKKYFIKRK